MNDNSTTVTKQETLAALRNPGELYVIMSAVTRLPFVKCDEETYDDELLEGCSVLHITGKKI